MTDCWTFASSNIDDEESEIGGMSVSKLFCKTKPSSDNETYPLFSSFIVPHGLVFIPDCNTNSSYTETLYEPMQMYNNYDRLFYLSAKYLGPGDKQKKSKTRKKITK
jgi:hypothetical protein